MTLEDMILEVVEIVNEEITKTDGEYEEVEIISPIVKALNFAYRQIAKDKLLLDWVDTLSPGGSLSKRCIKAYKVVAVDSGSEIDFDIENNKINFDYDGSVNVYYYYYPDKMVNLTDEPLIPEELVDHRILSYYAVYQYLLMQGDELAQDYYDNYKVTLDEIKPNRKKQRAVENNWKWR
jgi:hypothetical protein